MAGARVRSYISEPDRGRQNLAEAPRGARPPCTGIVSAFAAHGGCACCGSAVNDWSGPLPISMTGGMRRVHLRGHTNIRQRLLIHAGGFNLALLMRRLIGVGTPRGLQGRLSAVLAALLTLIRPLWTSVTRHWSPVRLFSRLDPRSVARYALASIDMRGVRFATGC